MFLELIATIVAGIAVAGLMMLLNRLSGRRLPRWLVPVGAGLGMIAVTISNEYSWFARTSATLPDGLTVIETVDRRAIYQPWTYVFPYTHRFAALDTTNLRQHDAQPGIAMSDLYFFGRWSAVDTLSVLADCAGNRRAALPPGTVFDDSGAVDGLDWVNVPADDPVLAGICGALS
ncbi:MAG: hypothetical protein OIF47_12490 [Marinibacterium sp.]|nr:hypothetical protein [Marinibacterium sp.]